MSFYDHYSMDRDAENNGVEIDYGDAGRIWIARAGGSNVAFKKAFESFQDKYGNQIRLGTLDESVAQKELATIYAKTVIRKWEDVKDSAGIVMEFNLDNCVRLLTDLPDLFFDLRQMSNDLALFRQTKNEDDAGN